MKKRNSNNTGGLAAQASSARRTGTRAPQLEPPEETAGRTIPGQWHSEPIDVEGTLHTAISHLIDGLQAQWRASGSTLGYFNDTLFKAHAIEDLLAILVSEMAARGARNAEDE